MRDRGKDKDFGDRFRGKGEETLIGVDEMQQYKNEQSNQEE